MPDEQAGITELCQLRDKIDALDLEIQQHLNRRAQLAQEVARVKLAAAQTSDQIVFYRPEREAQLLRKVMERNTGPLDDQTVARLFREIMSACLALEKTLSVAYLGPVGTFTHAAALRHFGQSAHCLPVASIVEVFRQVELGEVEYGVVPVENSTEGMVNQTLDCLIHTPLKVCGEVTLRIRHHLLVQKDVKPDQVKCIYSHQQSLAQCQKWLERFWPQATQTQVSSTAEAAQRSQNDPQSAAIAGDMAMEQYGLTALATCIEDQPNNRTRFLAISQQNLPSSGDDKTSVLIYTKNKPGSLYRALEPFHNHGINLTHIETRPSPSRGDWSYVFFVDFNGHKDSLEVQKLLTDVAKNVLDLKSLGSYPAEAIANRAER